MTGRPTSAEAITVAEWRNRHGDAVRIQLSTWQRHTLIDIRTWRSTEGKLVPAKGFAADVRHLPRLVEALVKAETTAREVYLIDNDGAGQ